MKLYHLYFRKIYGKVFVLLMSSWLPLSLAAQEQKSVLQMAEEAYGRQEYATAAALYERLAQQQGKRVKTANLMKLAACYRETGLFDNAGSWYARITTLPDCPPEAWFALGEVLRNKEQYTEAKQQYAHFTSPKADSMEMKALALRACDSALVWKQQPADVSLHPVKELNTEHSEIISGVVKDGLLLISNGYRSMQMNGKMEKHPAADRRTLQPYYKPYIFKQYSVGDSNVLLEELFPQLLGGYRYHIGPVCMSRGEDTLYVTINEQDKVLPNSQRGPVSGVRRLNIYQSVKQNGKWTTPVMLANINTTGYSSSYPVLAEQGSIMYFVSDRPEGQGQSDIWYSEQQPDGSWGVPVNCGPVLNTVAAEAFPTINEEGVLYFSSKGHPGMGGYDVFRAIGSRAEWQSPDNMKMPFNTGGDDIGLILKRNAYEGFLSSNRQGGTGADDIYGFKDAHFFERLRPVSLGDGKNGDGNGAGGNNGNNGNNGGSGNNGGNSGNGPGGNTTSENTGKRQLTPEEEKDKAELEKLQFFYNFNSTELLTESRRMLDYVAGVMLRHPDWKLVVVSYTDSRGTDGYNKDLSTMRCYSVINYLDDKGISPKRVYYRNMTRDGISNGCLDGVPCNEAQHQQNRRSELKIIF